MRLTRSECLLLAGLGLLLTAAGSSWYHLAPNDPGLAIDRLTMAVAFAGLLGLAAAMHVSARAGRGLSLALLLLAPAAVVQWYVSGNVLSWAVVQAGGMLMLLLCLFVPAREGLRVRWLLVLAAYALAKLFEGADHAVFHAGGGLLSGHTLKHLAAALAAWPVISALAALRHGQNAPKAAAQAA